MSKTKVVGYVRVSTDEQAKEGISLAAQEARIKSYAIAMELDLVDIITDAGFSSKTLDRPGIQTVLKMLEASEADGLLVIRLDRLTRSIRDMDYLLEQYFGEYARVRQCKLLSMSDSVDTRTASGRLVLNVLASIFQWERETIQERTREAMAHLKAKGVRLGPKGYRARPEVAQSVCDMYATGVWSCRTLAEELNRLQVPTYHPGAKWSKKVVAKIVRDSQRLTPVEPPC